MPVPDYTPPEDLVDLKTRWYAAKALADRIAAEEPAGDQEITIRPRTAAEEPRSIRLFSDDQNDRLNQARAELQRLTLEIYRYPWKQQQDDRHAAEKALNAVALERYESSLRA